MASSLRVNAIVPASGTNVAIGTAGGTITYTASVSGVSTFSSGIVVSAGTTAAPSISPSGDSNTGIFFPSADTIAFAEGGVEALRIDSSSNVGIGTAVPSQKLEVVGGEIKAGRVDSTNEGGQVSFGRATDNATGWYIDVYGNTSTPSLRFVDVSNAAVRATIDGSGRLTLPYQPSFYTIGTNYTQSTGTSIIIPNVVSYNLGSHYNGTTGRFTAPIAGRYIFGFWGLSYPHNTEVNQIRGFVNGSATGQEVQFGGAAHLHIQATGNLLLNLNANDIFDWRYYQASGSAKAYGSQWNMWGYLLG